MQNITLCARYKMADGESNMALLEIGMISGYIPDRASLHSLLEDPTMSESTLPSKDIVHHEIHINIIDTANLIIFVI